ncbi:MAG: hypothetical protein GF311_02395 [Candidatus Lokiarchaeota archaeon]|nr:hypothetical protein [Candidatus Lokiarchaeota archaeon]
MSLEICLSPLQKTLLVLAVKQEKGEETHFQDSLFENSTIIFTHNSLH